MSELNRVNRRSFLKGAAAAGTAMAIPSILPASVFGQSAPSNRIVMGSIGVGSQGTGNMQGFLGKGGQVQMVAVCDVDRRHRERAKQIVDDHYGNRDCAMYLDYRELIGRGDLDAIMTATPDHWHALIAVTAARAGLDIYGEKPLARTIREGRAICEAVQRHGRIWQTGSWQRSVAHFRRAVELVRNGRIGKVEYVEVGLPTGGSTGPRPVQPVPDYLDWNFWLGPAPWRPYCQFGGNACHWDWRWILDYSGGQLTDWAGHNVDIAHWGMNLDTTGPVEIEPVNVQYPGNGLYDAPMTYKFQCKYATGLTLVVANNQQVQQGAKWFGETGWIHAHRGGLNVSDPRLLREVIGPDEEQMYVSTDHNQNFLDCIRSRQNTITPVESAQRSISVGLLGELAMLVGRKIRWNPDTEQIIGDSAASALLGRSYREPWVL